MAYVPSERDCLLIPVGDVPHLHIVMNDPCAGGQCLLIMISSVKPNRSHDPTCLLNEGDYNDFIDHLSYAVYRIAETIQVSHIVNMVEKKYYSVKDSKISVELYNRIADGIYSSEETKPRIIKYADANGIDSYTE